MFVDSAGHRWYRTGDLAIEEPPGVYQLRGRIDRMVKRRGYRIELGEIEAAMNAYDGVREAAAIADKTDDGTRITVHLATDKGERLSTIRLKQFCSSRLPRFMIPDSFAFCVQLPRTPTGKIDYVALADRAN